uniref:Uncharacterized protein n=1 Tax=Romanomermis culicivorax TaxID=13658 RepID=A0A915IVA8_ROMCU
MVKNVNFPGAFAIKEINSTRATIIIDSQIPSCDENEDRYKIPEMGPKLLPVELSIHVTSADWRVAGVPRFRLAY